MGILNLLVSMDRILDNSLSSKRVALDDNLFNDSIAFSDPKSFWLG